MLIRAAKSTLCSSACPGIPLPSTPSAHTATSSPHAVMKTQHAPDVEDGYEGLRRGHKWEGVAPDAPALASLAVSVPAEADPCCCCCSGASSFAREKPEGTCVRHHNGTEAAFEAEAVSVAAGAALSRYKGRLTQAGRSYGPGTKLGLMVKPAPPAATVAAATVAALGPAPPAPAPASEAMLGLSNLAVSTVSWGLSHMQTWPSSEDVAISEEGELWDRARARGSKENEDAPLPAAARQATMN